jgi:hypothetical protein
VRRHELRQSRRYFRSIVRLQRGAVSPERPRDGEEWPQY